MSKPPREKEPERIVLTPRASEDVRAAESLRRQLGISADPLASKILKSLRRDRELGLVTPPDSPMTLNPDMP